MVMMPGMYTIIKVVCPSLLRKGVRPMNIEPVRSTPLPISSPAEGVPKNVSEEPAAPTEKVELSTPSKPSKSEKPSKKAQTDKIPAEKSEARKPQPETGHAAPPAIDMEAHARIHYGLAGTTIGEAEVVTQPPSPAPLSSEAVLEEIASGLLEDAPFNPYSNTTFLDLGGEVAPPPSAKLSQGVGLSIPLAEDSGSLAADTEILPGPAVPLAEGAVSAEKQRKKEWQKESIYFVLTDRFNDADKTNNQGVDKTSLKRYHGGDLQGVIDKLDYIKGLGMTAVWITPTMLNQKEFFDSDGYHGYWPVDFFKVDPHVGDTAKFDELIAKAHEKGLKIILDIPLNHVAWEHPYYKDPSKHNWFHHIGDIKDWNDPYQMENGSLFGLPDLAQENPDVEKYLIDVAKFWIDKGIDGFRLDAVKNVPVSFWAKFDREVHKYAGDGFLLVGEVFDGDPAKLSKYAREDMDSMFDYPLYFTMKDVFANDGSMRTLAWRVENTNKEYPHPELMAMFLDNHDTIRFLTAMGGNKDKFRLALAFLMTMNRIPTVYYGTEVGMEGSADIMGDLAMRKDMEWDKDPELLKYFKTLTSVRNSSKALQQGRLLEMWQDDKVFVFDRKADKDEAIVVLNNGWDRQVRDIPLRAESELRDGAVLKDAITGRTVTVQNRRVHVEMDGKKPLILLPQ
jgi:alpha-amylase